MDIRGLMKAHAAGSLLLPREGRLSERMWKSLRAEKVPFFVIYAANIRGPSVSRCNLCASSLHQLFQKGKFGLFLHFYIRFRVGEGEMNFSIGAFLYGEAFLGRKKDTLPLWSNHCSLH